MRFNAYRHVLPYITLIVQILVSHSSYELINNYGVSGDEKIIQVTL